MNGDPVLTQMPMRDSLNTANEGIQSSFQPRPGHDRHLFKANAGNRGNRLPYGNDGAFDPTNQPRNHNNRGHISYGQSVGNYVRSGNYSNHHRDANSNISNKGTRGRNQQHGHQQQSNGDNRRQEHSAKNNFSSNPSNHSQHYYHSNPSSSPQNYRKHSNDSGVMLSNTNQRNTISHSPPYEAYSNGGASTMPSSLSDESAISQTMNRNSHGHQSPRTFGARSQAAVDGGQHAEYMSHHNAQSNHRTSEQPIEAFNPQQRRAMSNHSHLVPSEVAYPQQQFYQVPWGYHAPHMAQLVPPVVPTAAPPQHATYDGREDKDEKPQPSPLQMVTSSMSAGAYGDQEHGRDRLREQLEWYFSTRNLATDTYLVSKMNADHWVSISVVADFKKVKALTNDLQEVVEALRRSNKVSVDATGMMVKAITVDRPRTTLILRELPEDTEEEEIRAIFTEAKCPAKLVTKEAVGNMWFIEFETASDALAMLNYTRGRYLREVPIAARLKSNSVLAGGEFRSTQAMASIPGNPVMPAFFPVQGWMHSPPNLSQDVSMFGMPTPYRRFPADGSFDGQDPWNKPPSHAFPQQELPHRPIVSHHYPPDAYLRANAAPTAPLTSPVDGYYLSGQMWVSTPGFSMPPRMSSTGKQYQEHGFLHPSQQDLEYVGGSRRSSDSELRVPTERGQDDGFINHRRENNRRNYRSGTGTRQNRHHEDHTSMDPQGGFPREAGFHNGGQHVTHSDPSSDSKSDLSSPGNLGQVKSGKKNRKHGPNNKVRKYPQHEKSRSGDQDGHIGKQSGNKNCSNDSTVGFNGVDSQDTNAQEQNEANSLSGKMSKLTTDDGSNAGLGRKHRNTDQPPKPPHQISLVLETDSFPPLPSNGTTRSRGDLNVAATQLTPPVQRSPAWVHHSARTLAGETTNFAIEQVGTVKPSLHGQMSTSPERPKVACADSPTARDSIQQNNNPDHQPRKSLSVNDANANLTPPAANNPEQKRVPASGMVASVGEETQVKSAAAGMLTRKLGSGNGDGDSIVITKTPGGFSYASVLRVQQLQQRETLAEVTGPVMMKGKAAMES